MNIIERQLQLCLNKIENGQWRMDLNFLAKTNCWYALL